jgi:predicted amino acid dehydrogenase
MIAVPSIPHLLLKNKTRSRKRVLAAVRLAEKLGAKVVGLGGLTSSLTDKGTYLISQRLRCRLTTGHSLTVATVIHTAKQAAAIKGISFKTAVVAIVGACGSIGSACSRWLVEENISHLVLNDVNDEALTALKNELSRGSRACIETTTDLTAIARADVVLVATNHPDLVLEAHHLKPGCVVIDDAQPPNVGPSVANGKVLLAWGGLLNIPGINLHLDIGLAGENTVFSCLGETVVLATLGVENSHTVGAVDPCKAKIIFSIATGLGISLAPLQAFGQLIEARICDERRVFEIGTRA